MYPRSPTFFYSDVHHACLCVFLKSARQLQLIISISFLYDEDDISPQRWRLIRARDLFRVRDLGIRAYRICQTPRSYVCIIRPQPSVRNSGPQSYYTRGTYIVLLCVHAHAHRSFVTENRFRSEPTMI